jgi:hypothetical protein
MIIIMNFLVCLGPKCDSVIDHVNPWRVLVFDRTLQSIAYKLVPDLYKGRQINGPVNETNIDTVCF